jgi:hypothetical protein
MLLAGTATVAVVALLPGVASASQVLVEGSTLVLRGDPGERNVFIVGADQNAAGRILFTDRTANPMTAAPAAGCTAWSTGWGSFASCPAAGIAHVRVEGGDGNDTLGVDPHGLPLAGHAVTLDGGPGDDELTGPTTDLPVILLGGPGDDALTGGQGGDLLDGGAGDDALDGGDGDDVVLGGEGDDLVVGGRTMSADVIDGGPGTDTSKGDWYDANDWQDRPITVTLDGIANDGRPGEGDNVVSVEIIETRRVATLVAGDGAATGVRFTVTNTPAGSSRLVGTPHADRLRTDHHDDTIEGGAGDDVIDAGYGSDVITPGPGRDTVLADGGPGACDRIDCPLPQGNDTIHARDGEQDTIDCGPGTDRVEADPFDILANCEIVVLPAAGQGSSGGTTSGGASSATTKTTTKTTTKARRCTVPRTVRPGTKLSLARTRLRKAGCAVKVKRVRSRRAKFRVVKVTVKGRTATVHVSRGRR